MGETTLEIKGTTQKQPSWRAEYDRKVKMSEEEQLKIRDSKWQDILEKAKELDKKGAGNEISLTEDEIAVIVSKYRRERYEASLRH
ncbi:hypothetical protein [Parasediminibacterium sp. JCM 36343]|uniref:hypothetical protein n=1 Tax=Parasediminibacterium sp. JCM 36343 TaxID=3374279 RepID=UPI00397ACAB9